MNKNAIEFDSIDGQRVRPVDGYGGKYLVSETGEVYSVFRMTNIHGVMVKIDKPIKLQAGCDKKGYLLVNLFDGAGNHKSHKVHRLVASAFLNNPHNKRCVCHKDNNPKNNNVSNLYWGTDKENQEQAWKDGLHKNITPVLQLTANGEIIGRYVSQSEASRQTNIPQQNIAKCVAGKRKSAGGYKWQKSV